MDRTIILRRVAQGQGLKRFYTGVACERGHVCERFVANGNCVDCQTFKTPNKRKGPKGRNVGWPSQGLVFNLPNIMPEEIEAAFRYMEHNGWHNVALQAVRDNPALLERFTIPLSAQEQGKLHAQLEKSQRIRQAIREEP